MRSEERKYSLADEQAYYSRSWPNEALPYRHLEPYVSSWLLQAGQWFEGKRVLDIGAGEAQYTRMLAEAYAPAQIVACELFTERMLPAKRASRIEGLSFVTGNCFNLPFGDGTFDVVFGSLVLSQLPELDRAIREIDRVLRPGGHYIGIEPNPWNVVVLYRFLRGRHSRNQYLFNRSHLSEFPSMGYDLTVKYFYARYPKLHGRLLTTCMGIVAKKALQ